ncbi:MAG: DUF748 domain-containing protein, partial [Planctomycetota bacterium]
AGIPGEITDGVRGLRLGAEVKDLRVIADGEEALGLDSLVLHAPRLSSRSTEIANASLRGLRANAATNAEGHLLAAGFELVPTSGSAPPEEPEEAEAPEEDAPPSRLALERLSIGDVALTFFEGGQEVPFELNLPRLTVDDLLLDPTADPERSMRVLLQASAPGLLESLQLEATASPFAPERRLNFELTGTGLRPDRATPYLEAAGIQSELESGRLHLEAEAGLRAEDSGALRARGRLLNFAFTDGPRELFGWNEMSLDELYHSAEEGLTRVGNLEVGGPRLVAERDAEGAVHALGLIFTPPEGASSEPAAASRNAAENATATTPAGSAAENITPPAADPDSAEESGPPARFELGRFGWTDSVLAWSDASLERPLELSFDDFGIVLENLALGGDPAGDGKSTADLQLWFSEPSLARDLRLSGHIDSVPGPLDLTVDLDLKGQGLTTEAVAPYLEEAGIEALFEEASLDLALDATVRDEDGDMAIEAALAGLRFRAAERDWLSLEELRVAGLR